MADEIKQQQIPINIDPNIYAITNVNISPSEEQFVFAIFSGNQVRQFLATPAHTKRIMLLLKQQVENYEKQFGELKTQLPKMNETKEEPGPKIGF